MTKDQLVIFAARSGNVAALRERVAAVEWLLANGADVNAQYGDQIGPLEVALYHPNPEVVGLLLRAGARLRKKVRPYYAARLKNCLRILGRQSSS